MSKKLDPRIIRTRHLLRNALMELITERDFDTITIRDITERATLNHATFYLHYKNKEELLFYGLEEMYAELAAAVPPPTEESVKNLDNPRQSTLKLFQHIADNRVFYRAVFGPKGVSQFRGQVRRYLAEIIGKRIGIVTAQQGNRQHLPLEFIADYLAGAYLGVIESWLESEMPQDIETLADNFTQLTVGGAYQALGLYPASVE
jgi:AcrR family transcriptional regulator